MKFYRINKPEGCIYASTSNQVKAFMKTIEPVMRPAYVIDEIEVATDKDSLQALLNNKGIREDATSIFSNPLRTWTVTSRGGLNELSKSEAG